MPLPADEAERLMAFADEAPARARSSMYHDLAQGRRLELGWLSGAVAELGREIGIDTPLNRAVTDILAVYADGDGRRD